MNRRVALPVSGLVVSSLIFAATWSRSSQGVHSSSLANHFPFSSGSSRSSASDPLQGWAFIADRDRDDHSLTSAQCDAAFPELYHEIFRSQAYWKEKQDGQKLTEDQWGIDWSYESGLRAMVYDGQLYVTESRGLNHFQHWEERSKATLANIDRALKAAREPIPNIEFGIKIDDNIHLEEGNERTTTWCFSRNVSDPNMDQVWLIPDFNFWAYPRVAGAYGDFQREAIQIGEDFDAKEPKLVWRGTQEFNPGIRQALLDASEGHSWSDVHKVAEDSGDPDSSKWRITMSDHCLYKFAVHTEGTTWSGRLKYLLSCHTTVFAHPLTFTTHLYHLLKSDGHGQNFVEARRDWSDLPEKMGELLLDNDKAKRIAGNAKDIFRDRYMTPAAQTCYFRRLFQVWSEMTVDPIPYVLVQYSDGTVKMRRRGMTYEEYIFHKGDFPV